MKGRDVFLSHSTKDVAVAEEICSRLERDGISVWIAPRDVRPGRKYGEEILDAIEGTRATILVLSEDANASVHVQHEIERAVSKGKSVFPVRVANVPPARALELFVASSQWIDLWGPGRAAGFDRLVSALKEHLGQPVPDRPGPERESSAPVVDDTRSRRGTARWVPWTLVAATTLAVVLGAGLLWKTGTLSSSPAVAVQVDGPAEAEVRLDGKLAGVARAGKVRRFAASAGVHALHVEAPGYWPYDKSVEIVAGDEPLAVRLAKKSSLVVTVDTPGATVSVNGRLVERPFPLELPDGQHTVEVMASGYDPFRKVVRLTGGAEEHMNVTLTKTKAHQDRSPQARGNGGQQADTQSQKPSGADAFLHGLGESVGRGGGSTRPPMPPFPFPRR